MSNFTASISTKIMYNDPEYKMFVSLLVTATADVSSDSRAGSADDIDYVNTVATTAMMEQFTALSNEKVGFKDLMSKNDVIAKAVADGFAGKDITVNSFVLNSVAPDEKTQKIIEQREKLNAFNALSEEEKLKKMEETNRAAQEYLNRLTPEQRQKAEEEAQKRMQEMAAERDKMIAEARAVAAGGAAAAAVSAPKFCTNCGAPSKGGKFCTNCGQPY